MNGTIIVFNRLNANKFHKMQLKVPATNPKPVATFSIVPERKILYGAVYTSRTGANHITMVVNEATSAMEFAMWLLISQDILLCYKL